MFAETQARRLSKYWLTGPQAGTVTPLAMQPARHARQPVDRRRRPDLVCDRHARQPVGGPAGAGTPVPPQDAVAAADRIQPKPESVVWAVAFDPDSGEAVAGLRTEHPSFGLVTGMVEAGEAVDGLHRRIGRGVCIALTSADEAHDSICVEIPLRPALRRRTG